MLAKFFLVVYIGKYLSINELGEYGLFTTTITIAIYFLGLDFYTYNTREILAKQHDERLKLIRDQFVFHLLVYVVILPLLLTVFAMGIIKTEFIVYFYLILIFEHLSQELYRLYTTLKRPVFANFLFFIRTGAWVYAVILLWISNIEGLLNLMTVWYGWTAGSIFSIIFGIIYLSREYDFRSLSEDIDWQWIKNGIKISIPFFIGTLAYKVIEFSDRYMIDYFMTTADVGIYTFFGGIANIVNMVVFTLVIMVYYPKLIETYQRKQIQAFKSQLNSFSFKIIFYSIVAGLPVVLLIKPVLLFMDKSVLQNSIDVLWLLVLVSIVLNISYIPHYVLFAKHKDMIIRNATLIGSLINVILNYFLIREYGIQGAAIATMLSLGYIFFHKQVGTREK